VRKIPRSSIIFRCHGSSREAVVEKADTVADNFSGEAVTFVGVWGAVGHKSSISKSAPCRQFSQVDNTNKLNMLKTLNLASSRVASTVRLFWILGTLPSIYLADHKYSGC